MVGNIEFLARSEDTLDPAQRARIYWSQSRLHTLKGDQDAARRRGDAAAALDLADATRHHASLAVGASPRAALGLRPPGPSPRGIRNCIAFQFQIAPPGIRAESDVRFDIARQKKTRAILPLSGSFRAVLTRCHSMTDLTAMP